MEQPAFTKSRAPAGGTSAALSLRSNVVGTYGSPTSAPSLYIRTPIARELLPAGAGSFSFIQTCSRVPDCYSAPLPLGTPRGCFFIWSNRLLPKAGRLQAGSPNIEGTQCFAILQGLSGVARELLSAGAVPPQTPRDLRSQTGFAGRLRAGLPLRCRSAQMW